MAVKSIIRLSKLEGAKRIDAEYYQPEYLENKNKLESLSYPLFSMRQLSSFITNGHTPLHADLSIGETLFLTAEDIYDFFITFETAKRITKEASHNELKRTMLKEGDLLITIKGKIGNSVVVLKLPSETNINQDVARIIFKSKINSYLIDPYFVSAFINSKFGRLEVERISTGQINPFLGLGNLKELRIPLLETKEQKDIRKIIMKAWDLIEKSNNYYQTADNLLLEELRLKDFKPKYELFYTSNLSNAFGVHRIDAEYFQPAYDELISKIINYRNGYTSLLNHVASIKPDFDPTKYLDKIFSYVELTNIDASIGIIHSVSEIKGEEAPSRARRILKKSDVIVSSIEGSLEKVALVDEAHEESLASTGFFQFRSIKISPEVLLILSKSIILQLQLKRECAGTILTAIPNESLKRIFIPILPDEIQQEIIFFIKQSHEARREASKLLEKAKRKVEETIENEIKK